MNSKFAWLNDFFQVFVRKGARTNMRNKALRSAIVASTAVAGLSGCVVHVGHHGHDDSHKSEESLSLSADSLSSLYVDSGAGSVKVKGIRGATSIHVSADIASGREDASDMIFTLKRDGDVAKLVGKRDSGSGFNFDNNSTRVNMTVTMPADLALRIDDGSGSLKVSHMDNDVSIDDGSGSLSVSHVVGNVDIKDGSGSLSVDQVDGQVNIDDNSGSLSVEHVTGRVDIDDGSGGIEVQDVNNEVVISDGSGGISVARVAHLNIVEAGSGSVSVEDVDDNQSAYLDHD